MNEIDGFKEIVLEVSQIKTPIELQTILKKKLGFPEFYGMNWDAFWDAITGLVELPDKIIINGWNNLYETLPEDARILKDILESYNKKYSNLECEIQYN